MDPGGGGIGIPNSGPRSPFSLYEGGTGGATIGPAITPLQLCTKCNNISFSRIDLIYNLSFACILHSALKAGLLEMYQLMINK